MKLASFCHWLTQKRRWLLLPASLLIAALLCLILPAWLALTLLAVPFVIAALLYEYLRAAREIRRYRFSRPPSPQDAQAEIVAVDASLIDRGTQLQAVTQPVQIHPQMSMRMGSGALLLGTAMVFLSDELPPSDAAALLRGAAQLNLRAPALRSRSPVIDRAEEDGMRRVTVQDGTQERSYFMADAQVVAACCGSIWEDRIRLMGQNDRERILDAAKYLAAGNCRVLAFATATDDEQPIFLGLAALGEGIDDTAVSELREMRSMGCTLVIRDDGEPSVDVEALRASLDVPDLHARPDLYLCSGDTAYPDMHCLTVYLPDDPQLSQPLVHLKEAFGFAAHGLRCLLRVMALCLLCACFTGSWQAPLLSAAILVTAYLTFARPAVARKLRVRHGAAALVLTLAAQLLMNAAIPTHAALGGGTMCILLTALCSMLLCPRNERLRPGAYLPVLIAGSVALVLLLLVNLSALPSGLLAAGFGAVCGTLGGLVCLLLRP